MQPFQPQADRCSKTRLHSGDMDQPNDMARVKPTAGRIRDFTCNPGLTQSLLWGSETPGLAVQATAGARAFVFQGKLARTAIHITIGDRALGVAMRPVPKPGGYRRPSTRGMIPVKSKPSASPGPVACSARGDAWITHPLKPVHRKAAISSLLQRACNPKVATDCPNPI